MTKSPNHIRMEAILSPSTKAADLLNTNYYLLGIMSRMGLRLGFGEATVAELCHKYNVDVNTFLLVANVYTFPDYIPSAEALSQVHISDIIRYLRLSHSFYMDSALVYLENGLDRMLATCNARQKIIIHSFYQDYREELRKHFAFEETTIFPYVEDLVAGKATPDRSIEDLDSDHSNIEEKVGDLKNIVMKYLPDTCDPDEVVPVLSFLFQLAEDLDRHTWIEDHILLPMIKKWEER